MNALPIACISGGDILVLLAIMAGASIGLLFLTYWPYRWAMNALARGPLFGKPLPLFVAALAGGIAWVAGTWGTASVLFHGGDEMWLAAIGGIGAITLCGMIIVWLATRKKSDVAAPAPVQPIQVWMQDMIVAVLCYGAGLTLISAFTDFDRNRAEEVLPYALYLMIAGTIGLFVSLDVSRRSPLGQQALPRAGIFISIFTIFPATLPVALLAWWRWRRAITKSEA